MEVSFPVWPTPKWYDACHTSHEADHQLFFSFFKGALSSTIALLRTPYRSPVCSHQQYIPLLLGRNPLFNETTSKNLKLLLPRDLSAPFSRQHHSHLKIRLFFISCTLCWESLIWELYLLRSFKRRLEACLINKFLSSLALLNNFASQLRSA